MPSGVNATAAATSRSIDKRAPRRHRFCMKDTQILTHVGPGTPTGELFRQYWVPVLMSSELEAGGAPVRVKLLGEELVAFRTNAGVTGLMDHRCPHRCASLFYGRNEEEGLR